MSKARPVPPANRRQVLHTVHEAVETSKSGVPAPAPHELRRERLLEVLHRHRARPLILLVAPAGFGKSTLAATYARESGGSVAWLTLQGADRDTRRLFGRLATALEAGFAEANALPQLRQGLNDGADGVGLARLLIEDLAHAPAGFILVIDDFHEVDDAEEVVNAVDALIRDLPEGGQIVITARSAPGLSMTRLVIQNAVFAFGTEDLRFSQDEARELRGKIRQSQQQSGETLDPAMAAEEDERDQRAQGWVAGILLGGAPRQLNIGGGSLLGSYVEREVLARLSDTEQGWLEMLSALDVITPNAAERMLGPANWAARLLGLTERCPFLVGGQDGTYRLHGLVRETALNRLRRSPDDRANQAWTVARQLAEEAGDPVGVVHACQELGQVALAVELVRRVVGEDIQTGRWPAVLVTLELLPEAVRRANPDLSLSEAHALWHGGHPDRAVEAAEAALHYGGRVGDVTVQIQALTELGFVSFTSDLDASEDWLAAADHLLRNSNLPTDTRRELEGRALGVRGICTQIRGDIAGARRCFEDGERLLRLVGPSRDLAVIQQNFGSFCNRTGDYTTAEEVLPAAAAHWRLVGDRNGLATTQIILGDLHLRLGKLDAAGSEFNDALRAGRAVGALRMEAHALVSLGQWHRANGRLTEAVAAFDEGIQLADEIVERELVADALVWRAEVALLRDELTDARQLLARAQAEGQRIGANATLAAIDRALGRLHLVDGAASRAIDHLQAALERAGENWGADQQAEALYWLGTAYLSLGRMEQASEQLELALALTSRANRPALLAAPAAEDQRLLQHGRRLGMNPVLLADIDRIASVRRPWTGVSTPPVVVLVQNELPRVEARLFGSFVLHRDGALITNASRKVDRVGELAALLILNPKGLQDEAIRELMFPDFEHERGLHNLQQAATTLRKQLGSKAAVRFGARNYQLSPQLELWADVREFDAALARARGAIGETLRQHLAKAVELYRGPLLADAGWDWLEPARLEYRSRFAAAALQLSDEYAPIDALRSDALAEQVVEVAPETDAAYERLILNAWQRRDRDAVRRVQKRYLHAAEQYGFTVKPYLLDDEGPSSPRIAR
jgi:LuxR family transcriptional regulator, maltose regulon positive regulatory protein